MVYEIVLDSDYSSFSVDLSYEFNLVKETEDGLDRSYTTISNQDPAAARHFGFQPGQVNPMLRWILYDNGEDKSNGSLSSSTITDSRFSNSTVTTVQEQIIWLQEYIMDNTSDPRWLLFGGRFSDPNGDGVDEGTNVVIEKPRIKKMSDRTTSAVGQIKMKLGVTI